MSESIQMRDQFGCGRSALRERRESRQGLPDAGILLAESGALWETSRPAAAG